MTRVHTPAEAKEHIQRLQQLVTSQEYLDAIQSIVNDPDQGTKAQGNPHAFFKGHGVNVPDDVKITVRKGSWSICANLGPISVCYNF